jgi:dienelactone hydrolase
MARDDNGTRCSRPAFTRSGGSVQTFFSRSISDQRIPREFKIYPGAPHGFHADYRASYRKEAAEDTWSQMQAWFRKYKVLG